MCQHVTASALVSASHIPGTANLFADISSCSFKMFFQAPWSAFLIHTDANFILAFNSPFSGHILEHCFPRAKHGIQCDLHAALAVIANASMDEATHDWAWHAWTHYTTAACTNPFLTDSSHSATQQVPDFAAHNQTGTYGKGRQVGCGSIETTLHFATQRIILAGYLDPQ